MSKALMHRFRRSGKQSFHLRTGSNLPVDVLLSEYTSNLLPQAPLHSEFLDMVFDLLGPYESAQAVADAFSPYVSQKEGEEFRQERDANNLICSTVEMLDKFGSRSAEKALRVELGKAFKERGGQPKGNRAYCLVLI